MRAIDYFYEQRKRAEERAHKPRRVGKVLRGTNISISLGLLSRVDKFDSLESDPEYVFPIHKDHLRG
jgi:hypothetical protein